MKKPMSLEEIDAEIEAAHEDVMKHRLRRKSGARWFYADLEREQGRMMGFLKVRGYKSYAAWKKDKQNESH